MRSSGVPRKEVQRDLSQSLDQFGHVFREPREARLSAVAVFVHIERPVDLDLQCVPVRAGASVEAGREPARIGCVDRDGEATLDKKTTGNLEDLRSASSAV